MDQFLREANVKWMSEAQSLIYPSYFLHGFAKIQLQAQQRWVNQVKE